MVNFNPAPSSKLHIDLNSCFARIEQQAHPQLRNKPIAVAAYASSNGCILAPSVEAKRFGVKTGMRVKDGRALCPNLIVLGPDPPKYRFVHVHLKELLQTFTPFVIPKSIDEFVLDFSFGSLQKTNLITAAQEMKQRIKQEIGEWLTVSIGIGPNRFLAKVGAGIHKPDGLDEINHHTYVDVYQKLDLLDLYGINIANKVRLKSVGIYTVRDFYQAPLWKLKAAFESILGYYWFLRLRGYEIDDVEFGRRSYGNSYSLPVTASTPEQLAPILQKLVEKTGRRLRNAGYRARGVHVSLRYRDNSYWHHGTTLPDFIFDSRDIYKIAYQILSQSPYQIPVHTLSESVFNLEKSHLSQLALFEDIEKKESLVKTIDAINDRWGDYVITPARMMNTGDFVKDRIAFGGVKELEEIIIS